MSSALLLDVGRVIIEPSAGALRAYEAATGTSRPEWEGLLADGDPDVAKRRGDLDRLVAMFRALAEAVPDSLFVPEALALIDDANRAGVPVGVLTNHAHAMLGQEWFAGRPELAGLTTFIDAAERGFPKPDPKAYVTAADELGVAPEEVVFLDDTVDCVTGARAVGMIGIVVDPQDRHPAFHEARVALGLNW
jgi:HAD superfamily hydrolase (TIGR01509 family)